MTLGNTGIKLSRLGFSTGSSNGQQPNRDWCKECLLPSLSTTRTIRASPYFDCAETYATFDWMGNAIKGSSAAAKSLFIQSKVPGQPKDILAAIDHHRKVYNTDYIDSLLIHCMVKNEWTDDWKRIMDGFNEAKEKKWIRAKGVSCHSLPALRTATKSDWTERFIENGARQSPGQAHGRRGGRSLEQRRSDAIEVAPVMDEIKKMHAKGQGCHRHENHRQRPVC